MKQHVKTYLQGFGYSIADFIPCEICEARAVDIHHIEARGMGGTTQQESVSNLMALCRKCHDYYGDKKEFKEYLIEVHNNKLNGKSKSKT
jgi:hypothetical protein